MAYASITYTSASGTTFALTNGSGDPISYIRQSDIEVYVNNVLKTVTTDYTFNSAGTAIVLNTAVSGATVLLQRITDIVDPTVIYTAGSTLTAQDLNNADNQLRYGLQEFQDFVSAGGGVPDGDKGDISIAGNGTIWNINAGVVTSSKIADGTIVNGDISPSAEIAVSKLADGAARQLLQTDAAGTGVEWTDNVDIPGTLDVTGAAVFDSTANIAGNLTVDTNTLFVDSTNNRVGVGTSAPADTLHLVGTARVQATGTGASLTTFKSGRATSATNNHSTIRFRDSSDNILATVSCATEVGNAQGNLHIYTANTSDDGNVSLSSFTFSNEGRLGIGTINPSALLDVVGADGTGINIGQTSATPRLKLAASLADLSSSITANNYNLDLKGEGTTTGQIRFWTGNPTASERLRIDSSGDITIAGGGLIKADFSSTTVANRTYFQTSAANQTTVVAAIPSGAGTTSAFYAFNDSDPTNAAYGGVFTDATKVVINSGVTGTGTQLPMVFFTNNQEQMRITTAGVVLVGSNTASSSVVGHGILQTGLMYSTVNADACATFNRLTNDGTIINLQQASVTEGTISVSGTTVSYNGAHLSRWSQLPSGAERTEILRGSVLSNIDEMCEWDEEENEQLNRMKVSDVEGDKNVSGVFQAWDDDDDTYTNDFYCAMTGDFIIRIAEGVTVERGDLLMSAGDGTAKPQDDDIIRSKTIAKVTSTNVSCTYEDNSYCVPCVLMAC